MAVDTEKLKKSYYYTDLQELKAARDTGIVNLERKGVYLETIDGSKPSIIDVINGILLVLTSEDYYETEELLSVARRNYEAFLAAYGSQEGDKKDE